MRAHYSQLAATDSDPLRSVVVPLLNFLLFVAAAVLAHKRNWRRYAPLQLLIAVPISTWVCVCLCVRVCAVRACVRA
jgi:hypothetical protein